MSSSAVAASAWRRCRRPQQASYRSPEPQGRSRASTFPSSRAGHRPWMAPDESDAVNTPDSQAEARALLQQLAASTALLPQDLPDDAEPPPEGSIVLPVIEQDGTLYVPVFTSEEALAAAGEDPANAVPVPLVELAAGW